MRRSVRRSSRAPLLAPSACRHFHLAPIMGPSERIRPNRMEHFLSSGHSASPSGRAAAPAVIFEQAEAALAQRKAELDDLHAHIESDVRNAFLDLQAASSQIDVARRNLEVTKETLDLTRQRLSAGVTEYVEVVQAEESVASADLDYINSVFAHNVAKLSLARAIGGAAEKLA